MSTAAPAQTPTETATPVAPDRRPSRRLPAVLLVGLLAASLLTVAVGRAVSAGAETTTSVQTFPVEGLREVVVSSGGVEVVVAERDDVELTSRVTASPSDEPPLTVEVAGGRLSIESACSDRLIAVRCASEHRLALPAGALDELAVRTTAGDVTLTGFAGDVALATHAGDVELLGFAGAEARIETSAGDVRVESTTVPTLLTARTRAGDVDVRVPDATYDLETATTVGDVDVQVRRGGDDHVVDVRTTAGDITVAPR